ncbi:MAG: metal ABC transporter substrate-binding protein [Nitrospira sp.]|nr:metal ABC transporter substrate-binding protein [Nitrospira sp.]
MSTEVLTKRCWLAAIMSIAVALISLPAVAAAQESINVVVTIPVLKDLAEQIGRSHVRVTSLLRGYENEHTYSPKPTDLVAVRNAKLLFEVGLGLEVWVTSLVKNAGSPSLRVVTTSDGISVIHDGSEDHHDDHTEGSMRSSSGNPHIWMDPDNVAIMVRHITHALAEIDPAHAGDYRSNQTAYLQKLDRLKHELMEQVEGLADRRFVAHHPAWPYLAKRFGFTIAATIQIHSGAEPSALHIQSLIDTIRHDRLKVIASEIQLSQKLPQLLSHESKAGVVVLTTLPGGLPGTETYIDMLRYNVLQLVRALRN